MDGFVAPDFSAPLSLETYLAAAPPGRTIRGVVFAGIAQDLERRGVALGERFLPFKEYPIARQLHVIYEGARRLYPKLPIREAIRRLGHQSFPTLRESLPGRVLFGALGNNPGALLSVTAAAYKLTGSAVRVEVVAQGPGFAHLHYRETYGFLDCYHVGVLEGVVHACRLEPKLTVRQHSQTEAEFLIAWGDSRSSD